MKPIFILGAAISVALFLLYEYAASDAVPDAGGNTVDTSSKVLLLASAIAVAEGFMDANGNTISANIPAIFHNPGDLGPGDAPGYASEFHSGSNIVKFPNDAAGWTALRNKLSNILNGHSSTYSLDGTFMDFAKKYAGDWQHWLNNVTSYLGVDQNTTLREWRDS